MGVRREFEWRVTAMVMHIGQSEFKGVGDMRGAYVKVQIVPGSLVGDELLIRSWLMYHQGHDIANTAIVRTTRRTVRQPFYRVTTRYDSFAVRIDDHYDHRDGVVVVPFRKRGKNG